MQLHPKVLKSQHQRQKQGRPVALQLLRLAPFVSTSNAKHLVMFHTADWEVWDPHHWPTERPHPPLATSLPP